MVILIVLLLVIVCTGVGLFAYGASCISSGILVKAICRLPENRDLLPFHVPESQPFLLTFDDGPDPDVTPRVLDVLDEFHHRAIFFLIGEKVDAHPDIVSEIVRRGHVVGNHTYIHSPWANFLGARSLLAQIRRTDEAIFRAAGVRPRLFRPPLGVVPHFLSVVMRRSGHKVVGWDVRSLDTKGEPRQVVLNRVAKKISRGSIVLLHDRLPEADLLAREILMLHDSHRE